MGVKERTVAATVLRAIDAAAVRRWDDALRRAGRTTGPIENRVEAITEWFTLELTAVGAAAGGVAAMPGVGTVASLAASAADVTWTTTRAAEVVMAMGAVHGHVEASEAERRAWIISVLAFGPEAPAELARIRAQVEAEEARAKARGRLSGGSLAALNQGMVRSVVTKWLLKKLATSIGKALPFGIGAAVGGVANRASARTIAHHAAHLFSTLPPAASTTAPALGSAAVASLAKGEPAPTPPA